MLCKALQASLPASSASLADALLTQHSRPCREALPAQGTVQAELAQPVPLMTLRDAYVRPQVRCRLPALHPGYHGS